MSGLADMMMRGRAPRSGPEDDLCTAVLDKRLPTDKRLPRIVFREPRLPTGFPDIVAVYPSSRTIDYTRARTHLTAKHVRVMHFLYWSKGARLSSMSEMLACSQRVLNKIVEHLVRAGMVRLRGSYVTPRAFSDVFIAQRIVAIETKISDWMKAIEQARANTWFASHSYILIRPHRSIETITVRATEAGVGVLVFDGDTIEIVADAAERDLPASYGSWLFNEWTLHRLKKERRL